MRTNACTASSRADGTMRTKARTTSSLPSTSSAAWRPNSIERVLRRSADRRRAERAGRRAALAGFAIALTLIADSACGPSALKTRGAEPASIPEGAALRAAVRTLEREVGQEESRGKKLFARVSRFSPRGVYIVVDTGSNRLYLMDGE